jgi:IS5 family transposase
MKRSFMQAAYSSKDTRDKLDELDIEDQVQPKGYRNNPFSEQDKTRNAGISVIRAGGERPFATYKQHYGLASTRFMVLANNATFYRLAVIAANFGKKCYILNAIWVGRCRNRWINVSKLSNTVC